MSKTPFRFSRRTAVRRFGVALIAVALSAVMVGGPAANTVLAKPAAKVKMPKTLLPLRVTGVVLQNGQLFAIANLGGNPLPPIPLNLSARPNPVDPTCPILDLELQAITLNLLGLNVQTSDICLTITAHRGEGLLGDLLCSVANLLSGGNPLGGILGALTGRQLNTLLGGLADLLDEVFILATQPDAIVGVGDSSPGACDILFLAVGPVNLNLLGLEVNLDDCADGPVTVAITAIPGSLLGDLLCDLKDLLAGGGGGGALATLLNQILGAITDILDGLPA